MTAIFKAYTLSECLDVLTDLVERSERVGKRSLIFCEDRLTLIAERAIARKLGGSFLTSVSTFSRFLKTDSKILGKQGSVMAIGKVMLALQRQNKLQCFRSAASIATDAKCIYETVAQFSASGVEPDTLKENAESLREDILKSKIKDLALIYEGYVSFLQENGYVDASRYLALLPDTVRQDQGLKTANVFFFGYTAFTAQALHTVRAAAETAENVIGVFAGGNEEFYTNAAINAFYGALCEYGQPKIYDKGVPLGGEAEVLRAGLFDPEKLGDDKYPTANVRTFEAEDKTDEAETVAANIRKLLAEEEGMRYRDIAVLLPDTKKYALPLKKAFDEYGIPYFFDEKISLARHPLCRFLLDCFEVVKEGFSTRSVQSLAGNFFFGESGEYRNYLLKYANYRGGAKKPIKSAEQVKDFDLELVENGRLRLLKIEKIVKWKGHGREHCASVREILREFQAEEKLEQLENEVVDTALKGYLSQVSDAIEKTLSEAEKLTADEEMHAADFKTVLEDGLGSTEISLIPLKTDAVFVGDVIDSRIEKVRALFAMGMTDETPRTGKDTALVSDKDIAKLAEVKTKLDPTVAEVNLRNRENFCLNLCAFTDKLYLSYPLSANGDEPALSDVFRYVRGLFADENGAPILPKKGGAELKYKCASVQPAVRELLTKKGEFERGGEDTREDYSALEEALKRQSVLEGEDFLRRNEPLEHVEKGEELFLKDGRVSPTALEGYFVCPFRNFAQRGLKLQEREETAVMSFDSGNFIHGILQEAALKINEFENEDALRAYAKAKGEELSKEPVYAAQRDTKAGEYAAEKLLAEGVESAAAVYRQLMNSDFTVEEVEKSVSTEDYSGKIDRVDGTDKYVRVIDYKTGAIGSGAGEYYTGRKMQLQLYMSAIKGARTPVGVFYFPAKVSYSEKPEERFTMKGFLSSDPEVLRSFDRSITEETVSESLGLKLKISGNTKRAMPTAQFVDFVDYSTFVAKQGKKEMKEGFITPSPCGDGCKHCKYGGMCGFNRDLNGTRKEATIAPAEIAEIAREARKETEQGGKN